MAALDREVLDGHAGARLDLEDGSDAGLIEDGGSGDPADVSELSVPGITTLSAMEPDTSIVSPEAACPTAYDSVAQGFAALVQALLALEPPAAT